MFKRIVCMLLVCLSLVGMFPLQAFAQTDSTDALEFAPVVIDEPAVMETEAVLVLPEADVPEETEAVIEEAGITVSEKAPMSVAGAFPSKSPEIVPADIRDLEQKRNIVNAADFGDSSRNERESNDIIELADPIRDNLTVIGTFGADGDTDWYSFTLKQKSYVEIYGFNTAGNTLNFAIFNSAGERLRLCTYNGEDEGIHQDTIIYDSLKAGTYYICFWDNDWWNYTYLLYLNATPITPKITSAANTINGLKLTWEKAPGAQEYAVFRLTRGASGSAVYLGDSVSNTYTDSNAISGRTYVYYVISYDTNTTYTSNIIQSKSLTYTRLANVKFTSVANELNGIRLKWNRVTGATGYRLYRQKRGATGWTLIKTFTSGATVNYLDKAISGNNGTTYRYRIRAIYKNTNIHKDVIISGYTDRTLTRLMNAGITLLSNPYARTMNVTWTMRTNVDGYQVRLRRGTNVTRTVNVSGFANNLVTFKNLLSGVRYNVQVRSFKTVNGTKYYGAWCTAKYITIR